MVGSNSYFDVLKLIWINQSTFQAFNVYPDEDSEDEIDNTKELQVVSFLDKLPTPKIANYTLYRRIEDRRGFKAIPGCAQVACARTKIHTRDIPGVQGTLQL